MNFGTYLKNGFKQLVFDTQATRDIVADVNSFRYSIILLVLTPVLLSILFFIGSLIVDAMRSFVGGTYTVSIAPLLLVFTYVFVLISQAVIHLLARLFGGLASIKKLFAASIAFLFSAVLVGTFVIIFSLISVIGVLLSMMLSIYIVAVFVHIVREVYQLSTARAATTVLLPVGILIALFMVLVFASFIATTSRVM